MSVQPGQELGGPSLIERLEAKWTEFQQGLIWQSVVRAKWFWLAAAVTSVGSVISINMTLSATARFIDDAILAQTEPMGPILTQLVVLFVLVAFFAFATQLLISWVAIKLEYDLRLWLYRGMHSLDPRRLDSVSSGQMITRAITDIWLLLIFIIFLPAFSVQVIILLGYVIWLFMQNVLLTIVATLAIPINILVVRKISPKMWAYSWIGLNRRAEVTTAVDETVRGIRVVKAFGREDAERVKLADVAARTFGAVMNRTRFLAKWDFVMKLAPSLINVALVLLAARVVDAGGLTTGVLVVYLENARRFANFATRLDNVVNLWMWARSGSGRIYELLGLLSTNREVSRGGDELPAASTGIEVEGVAVTYGEYPALRDVSFRAGYGDLVAVTGPPRSGRTTLSQVLSGELAPTEGRVLLDGVDVQTVHPSELRRAVVVVREESYLFHRSVRENLSIGARGEDVTDEELLAAVYAAGADDILDKLPHGLDTVLADRATDLSGGERQRLALARALVRPPRVLVLDDALTAVNPSFELDILGRIRVFAPQTAVLCLTRRDAATVVADRVVRLPEPAPGAPSGPEPVDLGPYGSTHDRPYDAKLVRIIREEIPPDTDSPDIVPEEACNESDDPPRVPNILRPLGRPVLIAGLLLGTFTLLTLVPPYIFQHVIDAINEGNYPQSDRLAFALFGYGLVFAGVAYVLRIYRTRVQEAVQYLLRRRIIHRITRLGIEYFDRDSPGYMSARVVNDINTIDRFIEDAVFKTITTLLQLLVVIGVLLWWNPAIALVSLAAIPVIGLLSLIFLPLIARAYVRARSEVGEVVNRLQEDFMGRYELQSFGVRTLSYEFFRFKARKLVRARFWAAFLGACYGNVSLLVMNIAQVALLYVAGMQALEAAITVGALAMFRQYLEQVLEPLPELANVVEQYLEARASLRRLREPFEARIHPPEQPVAPGGPGGGPVPAGSSGGGGAGSAGSALPFVLDGEIVLEDVAFTYPGTERQVLEGLNLGVRAGEMLALVGPTGAGKSSVAKLAARVYDPEGGGTIYVDGFDLREIDYTGFRRRVGYVPQETFLFRGTVRGNIAYGRPEASDEEIEEAAREVGAHEAIMAIPGGLDGWVEEDGKNLTAGQRTLVALVRAWLVRPDILLLDEATALLNPEMERKVVQAVRDLGCTSILITHRLHVAKEADWIVVVADGVAVEEGTHTDLIAGDGVYSTLWAYGTEVDETTMTRSGARSRARGKTATGASSSTGKAAAAKAGKRKASGGTKGSGTRNGGSKRKR